MGRVGLNDCGGLQRRAAAPGHKSPQGLQFVPTVGCLCTTEKILYASALRASLDRIAVDSISLVWAAALSCTLECRASSYLRNVGHKPRARCSEPDVKKHNDDSFRRLGHLKKSILTLAFQAAAQ